MSTERIALVVEDNDMSANVVRLFLEADGFTVRHCSSAEGALILAPKLTLALITLDLKLRGMNGWQFLLRLREDSTLAQVPVVIISGLPVSAAAPGLATWRGVVGALQKPFTRAQLHGVLADLGLHPAPVHTA
jgi:DNA-binding response OmpR family regulator